jgi:hypothetical protein
MCDEILTDAANPEARYANPPRGTKVLLEKQQKVNRSQQHAE